MIRFGPAAAPRWFGSDVGMLPDYLDLIVASGGAQIEFVVLPGAGSEELGRVHLLEGQWQAAFALCAARGIRINLHAPLLPEFRMDQHVSDVCGFWDRYQPVLDAVVLAGSQQRVAPILVVHADGSDADATERFVDEALSRLSGAGSDATIAIELRASAGPHDDRFDRSLDGLIAIIERADTARVGICWDIAHEWESFGRVTQLDASLIGMIRHVHVHDSRPDRSVHAPLGVGQVPWQSAARNLVDLGYSGSMTLEIRYRYASEYGDPWDVLRGSLLAMKGELEPNACR